MPRSKPAANDVAFFASDAGLLLERLVADGIVKARDIASARRALALEAEQLERRIDELKVLSQGGSAAARKPASVKSARKAGAARPNPAPVKGSQAAKRAVDPKRRAAMALQGRYLGLLHRVPPGELPKFKSMIASAGKAATVAAMEARVKQLKPASADASRSRKRRRRAKKQ